MKTEKDYEPLYIKIGKDLRDTETLIAEIDRSVLANDVFTVTFGNSYMVEITNENGTFIVTNGVDGYVDNCLEKFKGEPVTFLTFYHPLNDNASPAAMQEYKSQSSTGGKCGLEQLIEKLEWYRDQNKMYEPGGIHWAINTAKEIAASHPLEGAEGGWIKDVFERAYNLGHQGGEQNEYHLAACWETFKTENKL